MNYIFILFVGVLGPVIYIYIYRAGGPIRGHEVVRGGANIIRGVCASK